MTARTLDRIAADLDRLDAVLRPYDGEIDAAPKRLLAEFDRLHMERVYLLNRLEPAPAGAHLDERRG